MEQANPPEPSCTEDQEAYYASDAFRMTFMKVLPCSKRYVHDWTECPLAHPQEKARRRDPHTHSYTGIACPSMKKEGSCAFGDHCPYAHNVFEYWLHPTRYRTQLCNDGSNCRRKICFFAHSLDELRVPACKPFVSPEALAAAASAAAADSDKQRRSGVVGSPVANLAMPARLSSDSVRQSAEWGPAMPAPASSLARSEGGSGSEPMSPSQPPSPQQAPLQQPLCGPEGAPFSSHEQQVIDTVTTMLAQDKISPPQAATILQQMLPASSLQLLQSRLGVPEGSDAVPRAFSDPLGTNRRSSFGMEGSGRYSDTTSDRAEYHPWPAPSPAPQPWGANFQAPAPALEQMAAMQAVQGMGAAGGFYHPAPQDASARQSYDSTRSSFDAMSARVSLEGNRTSADFLLSGRGSAEYGPGAYAAQPQPQPYAVPAPAYPQDAAAPADDPPARPPLPPAAPAIGKQRYWTGQQLTTVPEGLPVVSAPAPSNPWKLRRSLGEDSLDGSAERLSSDFTRMSFEMPQEQSAPGSPPQVNPYVSSLFSGA